MLTKRLVLVPVLVLALAFGLVARAALAGGDGVPPGDPTCENVDFYVYNGYPGEVYLDVANWTTATREILFLSPGQEARFSLEAGFIEYWAEYYVFGGTHNWDDDVQVYLPGCSRVAAYIKEGANGPGIQLHVIYPE